MRIHVIGNAAFDEALAVTEWPRPGASILGRPLMAGPGGKGLNQAVVLGRAGLATRFVSGVGADARGEAIRHALATEPLELGLMTMPGRASDLSIVLTGADGENCIVTTTECAGALSPEQVCAALVLGRPGDALVLQGNLTEAATRAALESAGARGMLRVMNPSPLRSWQRAMLPLCEQVFVNTDEALALTGLTGAAAAAALRTAGVDTVVHTLGAAGALVSGPGGVSTVPAEAALVRDTTGAGDAFLGAVLAAAFARGGAIDAVALRAGTRASAITITRAGAYPALPSVTELNAILAP